MTKPIAISISPNTEKDDVWLALKILLSPFLWANTLEVKKLVRNFENIFPKDYSAFAINSGRSALYIILESLGIGEGDEVIIQAFTCVAVPNSILWTGAKPVYVDIDATYNIDPHDLVQKITSKTKAIIIQNTFGYPADYNKIKKVIKNSGFDITLIEDCAHSLGAQYENKKLGTLGDVAFFSFGRDKIISSVFGGMILTNNSNLKSQISNLLINLPQPSTFWTIQQLLHPIIFSGLKPFYHFKFTRGIITVLQNLKIISKAIYKEEKISDQPIVFPAKMSGALARLADHQLQKLEKLNAKRKKIVRYYISNYKDFENKFTDKTVNSVWLRFPIQVSDPRKLLNYCSRYGIYLGDWYKDVITPIVDYKKLYYKEGSCPNAEKISKHIVNLPTYPTMELEDAQYIVNLIQTWHNLPTK